MNSSILKKNSDFKIQSFQESEIKCQYCGAKLWERKVIVFGTEKTFKKSCECVRKHNRENEERMKHRDRQIRISRLFQQSRLGKRFKESKFSKIIKTKYNSKCIESLEDFTARFDKKSSFLISSKSGTGKTLMTSATVNALLNQYVSCVFINVPDLMTLFEDAKRFDSAESESQLLDGLMSCDMLVLDDLGAEEDTNKTAQKIYQIVNKRYADEKSTIFTTNLNSTELKERVGTRTFSRIVEMCGKDNMFNLDGEKDWRLSK